MVAILIITLLISLAVLVFASEKLVDSAMHITYITGFSEFAMGIVFIAIGTSLPELSVSIMSIFTGTQTLSIGTLFGSSIADMTLVFGVVCLGGFVLTKKDIEVVETILLSCLVVVFALLLGEIDIVFGIFSIVLFSLFLNVILRRHYVIKSGKKPWILTPDLVKHVGIVIISIIAVVLSASFVVESATGLADLFGISSMIIGALIVGIGSVLPELTVSIIAVRKGNFSLAIGNVTGSVIVNIVLIIGIMSIFNVIRIDHLSSIVMYSFLAIGGIVVGLSLHRKFTKLEGIGLMLLYVVFVAVLLSVGVFI
ncbi:MAG: hypothetical protein V1870_02370 [Candidatus Aenigmatarchaeota archaeon]